MTEVAHEGATEVVTADKKSLSHSQKKTQPIVQWVRPAELSRLTTQETEFADWLKAHGISFEYEVIQLRKERKNKVRKKYFIKRPDFVIFPNNSLDRKENEFFFVELTDVKRPPKTRPTRIQADPKKVTRHLARLANVPCAVIYGGELSKFMELVEKNIDVGSKSQDMFLILREVALTWNTIEWQML